VSQKPPFGTQHPGGDAFDIEKTFFDKHGEDLYIYTQDYYPDWPYNQGVRPGDDRTYVRDANGKLTSEWTPGGDGVWDYLEVLEIVTEAVATGADDPEKYTFIPFNELDLQWLNTDDKYNRYLLQGGQPDSYTPGGASDWAAAWKVITDVYAKHGLSRPRIAGPGDAAWRGEGNIKAFLRTAIATNTVPDVYVWHELRGYQWMPDRASAFRQYARDLGIAEDEIPQINITEYGASNDMSSPANLLRWFSSFEAAKIDAQTAYWTASGTLSDNQAKVNAANGGWWMFKWYGDLQGAQTAEVTANREKAIAAIDDANRRAQVLVGGVEQGRDGLLTVKGLSNDTFGDKVDIEVREDLISGTDGVADTPRVVAAYDDVAVSGGSVQVRIPSANASAAYQVIITPAPGGDVAAEAAEQAPHQWSEAENLAITGGTVRSQPGGGYRLSGDCDVMGLTGARKGSIKINGVETIAMPTHRIAHLGVGYCPEERGIFSSLSCEENLLLPPTLNTGTPGMSVEEIYDMFPNLAERRSSQGTRLSGGEQQMLAVARILRTGAKLLLLDEISEGLAPVIVQALARMITTLRAKGYTVVMVEQNFRFAAPLADRFYVIEHGTVVQHFESAELEARMPVLNQLLGI